MNPFGGDGPIGRVSSGGSTLEAQTYTYASRSSTADPHDITSGIAANADDDTVIDFTIGADPVSIPNATDIGGAYVEWTVKDHNGDAMQFGVDQNTIQRATAWLRSASGVLPADTYIGLAMTAGGVATIGNSGIFVGIQYDASGNEAFVQGNAGGGAGWSAQVIAGAPDLLTRGAAYQILVNNTANSVFRQVVPVGADGKRSAVSGSSPIAPSANNMTDGPFTHVALVVGCTATSVSLPVTLPVSLRTFFLSWSEIDSPDLTMAAPVIVDPPLRIAVIGDSNGVGTTADADFGGDNVQTGWTYRSGGANAATWPTGGPECASLPYLVENAIARGASAGTRWIARRATAGLDAGWIGMYANVTGLIADVTTLGGGDPHMIVIFLGANDSQSVAESEAFLRDMRRQIICFRYLYRNAAIVLVKERNTNAGSYPNSAEVQAYIDQLATEFAGVYVADSTTAPAAPLFDDIHFSSGIDGGYDVVADRAFTAVYG